MKLLSQKTDAELVQEFMMGKEKVFNYLVLRYEEYLYNFILSKLYSFYYLKKRRAHFSYHTLSEVTKDISQTAFMKTFISLRKGRYREENSFKAWLGTITHNVCIDYYRRGKKMDFISIDDQLSSSPRVNFNYNQLLQAFVDSSDRKIIDMEISLELRELIQRLPTDQRDVLIMRIFKEMAFKEISQNTGVSINTALGRMRYALINLRKMIKSEGRMLNVA